MRRIANHLLNGALALTAGLCLLGSPDSVVRADPPPMGPPCAALDPDMFCIRLTWQEGVSDPEGDKYLVMVEFLNWTNQPCHYIRMDRAVCAGSNAFIADAGIDQNGRPFGPGSDPLPGNIPMDNYWTTDMVTADQVLWKRSDAFGPLPNAMFNGTRGGQPFTFNGLLDPSYNTITTPQECREALVGMIPGSNFVASPPTINVDDFETVDNGPNVLDGFYVVVDDLDPQESICFNWVMLDESMNSIGMVFMGGVVVGDQFGFGDWNYARINSPAPPPIFTLNGGFDPPNSDDPDQDSGSLWGENEVEGIDTYPFNPIREGFVGAGQYMCVEFGAAVTAAFVNPNNNCFFFNGQQVQSGINLPPRGGGGGGCLRYGDINEDGMVDIIDLALIIRDWGQVMVGPVTPLGGGCGGVISFASPARCDLDGDFQIGIADIAVVIRYWGIPCVDIVVPVDQ